MRTTTGIRIRIRIEIEIYNKQVETGAVPSTARQGTQSRQSNLLRSRGSVARFDGRKGRAGRCGARRMSRSEARLIYE